MTLLAYTHPGYIAAGWLLSVAGFLLFVWLTVRRGRALSEQVPPEERRWS